METILKVLQLLHYIAIIVGVVIAFFVAYQNKWLSGSGFESQELVKTEIAQLLTSLNSIMYKYALSDKKSSAIPQFDLENEILAIQRFLVSQTSLALYIWSNEKSKNAKGGHPEEWRAFFLRLYCIALSAKGEEVNKEYCNTSFQGIVTNARGLEKMIRSLTEEQIKKISKYNSDLARSISQSEDDMILGVIKKQLDEAIAKSNERNNS